MTFLIDNFRYKLSTIINEEFVTAHDVRFAVAFLKQSGLQLIESSLNNCINNGNSVEFIVGLDFRTTEAMPLKNLLKKAENTEKFHLYCYSDPSDDVETFHPKLYLFRNKNRLRAIVGSSNITRGGLQDNVELNVVLDFADSHSEEAQPFYDFYSRVKYKSTCFIPNEDYLNLYFELQQKHLQYLKPKKSLPIEQVLQELRIREKSLPKPFASQKILSGWQKLIFQYLPKNEFTTDEMYRYVKEFQKYYPENKHIQAKIRQVLQQLRDLGFIIHLGQGRWIQRESDEEIHEQ
ncbi:MAG: hypothetical protein JW908_10490 [Anaerolineales bacterium]|nr:hypothetical protein [Anaerolineales bacterium]